MNKEFEDSLSTVPVFEAEREASLQVSSHVQVFEGEIAIAEEADLFLKRGEFTREELIERHRFLIKKYRSLMKQATKIVKVGDSTQARLIRTQHELDKQNEELAKTVEQLRISEQKALEANRAKSTFLANMSHELRTPLNAILGFVQVMQRRQGRDTEDTENLQTIMRSGEHLLGLINDVLSISKIEAGKITLTEHTFHLPKLLLGLEEMIRVRAQSKGLQLSFEISPELPEYVLGDEGKLRQVLINLLGNAVKFTERGQVTLRVFWSNSIATFEIEDTGHGISKEEQTKLFEPFVQTESGQKSTEGTGLGLAISRNFVNLMGGEIWVRSELGEGTTFCFTSRMPQSSRESTAPTLGKVIGLADHQPAPRILIVDDKEENRQILCKLLSPVGFQVTEAINGVEAITQFKKHRPDLILMDLRMPILDGYEATKAIRQLESALLTESESALPSHRTSIIALSAMAFEHDREAVHNAGCDGFLAKPFREEDCFEVLRQHLNLTFKYESAVPPRTATFASSTAHQALTRERLAALPKSLQEELHQALIRGDTQIATDITRRVRQFDAPLAEELMNTVKTYCFDEVLDLLETI